MKIKWSKQTKLQIKGIFDYLKSAAGTITARRVVQKILAHPRILENNPLVGQREELLENDPREFRYLVEGNYKIVYYINGDTVFVSDIWDCRRDPEALREGVLVAEEYAE